PPAHPDTYLLPPPPCPPTALPVHAEGPLDYAGADAAAAHRIDNLCHLAEVCAVDDGVDVLRQRVSRPGENLASGPLTAARGVREVGLDVVEQVGIGVEV